MRMREPDELDRIAVALEPVISHSFLRGRHMRRTNCTLGNVIIMTLKHEHDLPMQSRHDGEIPIVSSSALPGSTTSRKQMLRVS